MLSAGTVFPDRAGRGSTALGVCESLYWDRNNPSAEGKLLAGRLMKEPVSGWHWLSRGFSLAQRRHDRREFHIRGSSAVCVELRWVQEHHAALTTRKKFGLVSRAVLSQNRHSVESFIATDPATPSAGRDGKGSGHGRIVVTSWRGCPCRSSSDTLLDGQGRVRSGLQQPRPWISCAEVGGRGGTACSGDRRRSSRSRRARRVPGTRPGRA